MGNETVIDMPTSTTSTAIIDINAELEDLTKSLQQATPAAGGNFIRTKAKVFTMPEGLSLQTLECVIVAAASVNVLLPPYKPGQYKPALCAAINTNAAHLAPTNPAAAAEWGSPKTCAECVKNQWGSDASGKKACSNRVRLAITPADATPESPIYMLTITPTALKRWNIYTTSIAARYPKGGVVRVVTEMTFSPATEYPTLIFKAIRPVPDDQLPIIIGLSKIANALILDEPQLESEAF